MFHTQFRCALLAAGAATVSPALGDALFWNNPSGGAINSAANWSPMQAPDSSSYLIFALPNTYTVTTAANQLVDKLDVTNGSVTFDCQGHTLTSLTTNSITNPGFFVNCLSGATFSSATLINGSILADSCDVGQGQGTTSQLNIGAGGVLRVHEDFALAQYSGTGNLRVSDGGQLAVSAGGINIGGPQFSCVGNATVTGAGSVVSSPGIYIALQSAGSLLIDAGGQVQTTRGCQIGENGAGNAAVRGVGSVWQESMGFQDSVFYVGADTAGTHGALAVLDGGRVISAVPVTVLRQGVLCGNSVVQAGVTNGGQVSPGGVFDDATHAVVTTGRIGTLSITGPFVQQAAGSLNIELLNASSYDALVIGGPATLAGNLSVTLLGGFVPQVGQSFQLLAAGSRAGVFSTATLPGLPAGETWDLQYSATNVTLAVVPGPASLLPLLLTTGIGRPRRRSN